MCNSHKEERREVVKKLSKLDNYLGNPNRFFVDNVAEFYNEEIVKISMFVFARRLQKALGAMG